MRIWLFLLPAAILMGVVALILIFRRHPRRWQAAVLGLLLGIVAWGAWALDPTDPEQLSESGPAIANPATPPHGPDEEFITSQACRECHPKEHASWHDSFHRTMTQVVTPETVLAPLDEEVTLQSRGRSYRLWREGDEFFINMVDPDWDAGARLQGLEGQLEAEAPRVDRQLVMSTGSHHYQTYWVNSVFGNEMRQIPWVWHRAEERWMPAEDAFITPPDGPRRLTVWNSVCIQCHAVHGQPGLDPQLGSFTSRVSEFGISCEACHGPARAHVDYHRKKEADTGHDTSTDTGEDPIVNPHRLPHDRSSQVCGQCHSYFSFSDQEFWQSGFKYRAGDDLHATRNIHDFKQPYVQGRPDLLAGYWRDGTMRLAGREFSAMDDSACYQRGEMSCLSCHSMHAYDKPDDLLSTASGSENCLQCHESFRDHVAEHTHHAADSAGSDCYNCHMPHTSFGLLKAIRSHRIDSPTAKMTAEFGRPNACNLCHSDQTLQWTAERLTEWYGQEPITLDADQQELASSLLLAIRGDAVQRAVSAWSLGWEPARQASADDGWQIPFLALLLIDPYSGVRFTAFRSLREYPGFEDFEYDHVASPQERSAAMREVIERWRASLPAEVDWNPRAVMLSADGALEIERVQPLMQQRDDRPIELPE